MPKAKSRACMPRSTWKSGKVCYCVDRLGKTKRIICTKRPYPIPHKKTYDYAEMKRRAAYSKRVHKHIMKMQAKKKRR